MNKIDENQIVEPEEEWEQVRFESESGGDDTSEVIYAKRNLNMMRRVMICSIRMIGIHRNRN